MTASATRREVLLTLGSAALGGLAAASAAVAAPVTVEQFRQLSARLLRVSIDVLDRDAAATLLRAFVADGREDGLSLLAADASIDTGTLANEIVAAWYSGICRTLQGTSVATFTNALVWSALDYTKPFGVCGGETGYWALPPQA